MTLKVYSINIDILNNAINKTKINKSLGRDKITGFWYKKLTFYRPDLTNLFQQTLQGDTKLPKWLSLALTSLLPKNNETHIPKNYSLLKYHVQAVYKMSELISDRSCAI